MSGAEKHGGSRKHPKMGCQVGDPWGLKKNLTQTPELNKVGTMGRRSGWGEPRPGPEATSISTSHGIKWLLLSPEG